MSPHSGTSPLQGPKWDVDDFDSCPSASQVSLDNLDVSELSQAIVDGTSERVTSFVHGDRSHGRSDCSTNAAMSLLACAAGTTVKTDPPPPTTPNKQVSMVKLGTTQELRVVDDLNLPAHTEGKPRQQKVRHWASQVKLMQWTTHTRNLGRVKEVLDQYPVIMEDMALSAYSPTVFETSGEEADKYAWTFVVPKALVTSMQAAIETFYANKAAAQSDQGPDEIDLANSQPDTELHAVVKLRTNLVFFSRRCVVAIKSFYEVTQLASAWRQDMKWLDQD
ncbi:hypothetical protein V7S43_007578 [Phytophthora oleae]|uniref:Uncharacterized protein n=1 Tax=Phytophthora oleae TaxID=2107226 RepID=A0ABD3FKB9_9STRA